MNANVMPTQLNAGPTLARRPFMEAGLVMAPPRPPAEWLPVPRWIPAKQTSRRQSHKSSKTSRSVRETARSHSELELLCMALLAIAAVLAIAHGFSSMLDLVQNW